MGEVNYKPLIDDMVWSYSRVGSYEDCPKRWYLKYIRRCRDRDKFYACYGSFMHKLIEQYYNGELSKENMITVFLRDFKKEVRGFRPKSSTLSKFIDASTDYLSNFQPFPFKMIAVEKKIEFNLCGHPFVGYIDFLGEDSDGNLVIVDNKSRDLKPRSGREKPTLNDLEIDKMLRQLYLYSMALEQEYGKLPSKLCFNCFRNGTFIVEDFKQDAYEEAKQWAEKTILEISEDSDFEARPNPFSCFWICGVDQNCEFGGNPWDKKKRR